ncbi:MAG: GNAT family N-acetyltransferase [Promethearchaeota archaeon]
MLLAGIPERDCGVIIMLKGKRVTLRGVELTDVEEILKHFNDLEIRQFLGEAIPIAKPEEEEWVRSTWAQRREGRAHVFGIEFNETQQLIGTCGLHAISPIHRSTELGIAVWNKDYWGKGLGTEALRLLLDYAFNQLNLHRVWLRVIEDNERAIHIYLKVGFQHTGRLRQCVFKQGGYQDLLIMDILEDEYHKE